MRPIPRRGAHVGASGWIAIGSGWTFVAVSAAAAGSWTALATWAILPAFLLLGVLPRKQQTDEPAEPKPSGEPKDCPYVRSIHEEEK